MRVISLLLLSFILFVNGEYSPFNYHARIGIRKAEEVRKFEEDAEGKHVRIVGGAQVAEGTHISHQAGIIIVLTTGWTSICGGALVSNTRVLTAAHCWNDGQNQARLFTIVLGSRTIFNGGTRLPTTAVTVHPSWNPVDVTFDIAVAAIPSVTFNNNIMPVALPTLADMNVDFSGMSAIVSGYGKTSDAQVTFPITTTLHQSTVSVITNAVCQQSFEFPLHVGVMCTSGQGGVGTCEGDSGGPLTVSWNTVRTLVGIVSFGLGDNCEAGQPSVYTRVTAFISWINANL